MQSTAKNRAYQRGLKAAGIWKGIRNRLKQLDMACVRWAARNHLPKLIGHIPVVAGLVLFVSGILLGSAILSVVLLFAAGLASILCGNISNKVAEQNHSTDGFVGLSTFESSKETDYFDLIHPHNDPHYHGCPYGDDVKNYNQ